MPSNSHGASAADREPPAADPQTGAVPDIRAGAEIPYPDARRAVRTLVRLQRAVTAATPAGLSMPQYRMLVRLSAGGERSARLADALRVRKPTLTALADGLVNAGLASRIRDHDDRRVVRLELTDAGRAALDEADRVLAERLGDILGELHDPRRFVDDLAHIEAVLESRAAQRRTPPEGESHATPHT
ncbi:MarR family winged helix-turn-helix transcriptional regulator [Phytoactinopolyspora endophytica]|uniref:MarR family winged helix-turn-helix transcriptional regulator n=1 Tax=Phytoactinopolyspora endophytica TaxID=1642495 RepID=UPI00101C3912|nr:MarR family transcriptional regulator [Phytoactinopolyspora endophytica]